VTQTITVDETSYMRYFVDDGAMVGVWNNFLLDSRTDFFLFCFFLSHRILHASCRGRSLTSLRCCTRCRLIVPLWCRISSSMVMASALAIYLPAWYWTLTNSLTLLFPLWLVLL
jgi:hypothetical protein